VWSVNHLSICSVDCCFSDESCSASLTSVRSSPCSEKQPWRYVIQVFLQSRCPSSHLTEGCVTRKSLTSITRGIVCGMFISGRERCVSAKVLTPSLARTTNWCCHMFLWYRLWGQSTKMSIKKASQLWHSQPCDYCDVVCSYVTRCSLWLLLLT